ncbi:hypothetical protein ABT324_09670 [Saccharopolyspora sp. NPDC000359]|uniref:hypothetical protein n=1 Tax=Saccharopolyspora sp. NPDC000359 TaxID=3154251 RepID=UPI0033333E6E
MASPRWAKVSCGAARCRSAQLALGPALGTAELVTLDRELARVVGFDHAETSETVPAFRLA